MKGRRAQTVLDFWFGRGPPTPAELTEREKLWFGATLNTRLRTRQDRGIVLAFGKLIKAAADGDLDHWAGSPNRLLALILLLDQFPRNAFRGRARAFARDHRAQALTLDGLTTGADAALLPFQRLFFYMPLQHAESAEIQEESVTAFRRLAADAPPEHQEFFAKALASAEQHRDVIRQFGRFPQRNAALGRSNTAEEAAYIKKA
ncbi:MAG: DUF924 family protein, partial [Steroidobacteraceae bacterium]